MDNRNNNSRPNKTKHSIEEVIQLTAKALASRVNIRIAEAALIQDGFNKEQAKTIVRWAQQLNSKTKGK